MNVLKTIELDTAEQLSSRNTHKTVKIPDFMLCVFNHERIRKKFNVQSSYVSPPSKNTYLSPPSTNLNIYYLQKCEHYIFAKNVIISVSETLYFYK